MNKLDILREAARDELWPRPCEGFQEKLYDKLGLYPYRGVKITLSRSPSLAAELREFLMRDNDKMVRAMMARRDDLTSDEMMALARDHDFYVRETIARRPDLPQELRAELARDPSEYVRAAIKDGTQGGAV